MRQTEGVRLPLTSLLFLLVLSCSGADSGRSTDRVEIALSGWSGIHVIVNKSGAGEYERSTANGTKTSGSFAIGPEGYDRIVARLEPFRRDAVPFTQKRAVELLMTKCPKGTLFTTDQGFFWARWTGRGSDEQYFADLGCDARRYAKRNTELLDLVSHLPVPHV